MQRPGPACDGPACNVTEGPVQAALTPGTPAAVGSTSRLSVVGLCDVTPPRLSKASPPEPKQAQHAIHSNALIGKLEGGLTKAEARAEHIRQQYSWLSESQVRDAMGKRPGEVGYDPRTLLLPPSFRSSLKGAKAQYWNIKKSYRDVILFFKVGSFYELYEDDAEHATRVLGWKMTLAGVGQCRQVGCPAGGLDQAMEALLAAGHKVGIIEQLETTQEAKAARGSLAVVRRELTSIVTPATHGASTAGNRPPGGLLCLSEGDAAPVELGLAMLDPARGTVLLGAETDASDSRACLRGVLARLQPREVLVCPDQLSKATRGVLADPSLGLQVSWIRGDVPRLCDPELDAKLRGALEEALGSDGRSLNPKAACHPTAARAALCGLARHVARMQSGPEMALTLAEMSPLEEHSGSDTVLLDGRVVESLGLDGAGALLEKMDTCATLGGSAKLRGWVLAPLTDANKIAERLDAVEYLMARPDACMVLRTGLRRCRDLVQCLGALRRAHAEPPAALPVDVVARAQGRRLRALLGCVEVLRGGHDALTRFSSALSEGEASDAPPLLRRLVEARVRVEESGALDALAEVGGAVLADKKGRLRLCDSAVAEMAAMDGIDANPAGDGGDLEAEVRCTTAFVTRLLSLSREWKALDAAVSTLDVLISFAAFSSGLPGTVCRPDVLPLSATTPGAEPFLVLEGFWNPMCVPATATGASVASVVPNDMTLGGEPPSDSAASGAAGTPRAMLLTGPNMGGKSTAMRCVAICAILAQSGCMVPASRCRMSAVSRIFVRMGAQDRLEAGSSTFHEECLDASLVLNEADQDSLVILDELGRGTSTFDGHAIAHATLHDLVMRRGAARPRLLFSTHYHQLADEFGRLSDTVALRHMACEVREAGPGQRGSRLVLLYRMTEGVCPRSYGYEVASLAGIAGSVVERAREVGPSIGAMGEALLGRKRKRTSVGVVGDEEAAAREGRARGAAPGWEGTSVLESTVCEAIAAIMSGGDAAMRARDMCLERLTAGIAG